MLFLMLAINRPSGLLRGHPQSRPDDLGDRPRPQHLVHRVYIRLFVFMDDHQDRSASAAADFGNRLHHGADALAVIAVHIPVETA